jgi:hypothetical protein
MPITRRPWFPWLLYLVTLVSAWPLGAIMAAAYPQPAGSCSGIGFGCSLYGWDLAAFALYVLGIPYAAALALVLGLLALLPDRWAPLQVTVAVVGLAVPWMVVVAGVSSQP